MLRNGAHEASGVGRGVLIPHYVIPNEMYYIKVLFYVLDLCPLFSFCFLSLDFTLFFLVFLFLSFPSFSFSVFYFALSLSFSSHKVFAQLILKDSSIHRLIVNSEIVLDMETV